MQEKNHNYGEYTNNYYFNDTVYLVEDLLKTTFNPPYGGEVTLYFSGKKQNN